MASSRPQNIQDHEWQDFLEGFLPGRPTKVEAEEWAINKKYSMKQARDRHAALKNPVGRRPRNKGRPSEPIDNDRARA